ncbi:MAG TPA: hypothetical protein VMB05_17275 [Solirubrobacteraceae bacterium]|nr:hypothetical protein [Solirubrobacteraceae bacterium]
MPIAANLIKWDALGEEALIGLAGGVGLVVAYGGLLVALNARAQARAQGRRTAPAALAGGLFAVCVCVALLAIGFVAMTHKS